MLALQNYASSDDDDEENPKSQEKLTPYKPSENSEFSIKKQLEVCAAPLVLPTVSRLFFCIIPKYCKIFLLEFTRRCTTN